MTSSTKELLPATSGVDSQLMAWDDCGGDKTRRADQLVQCECGHVMLPELLASRCHEAKCSLLLGLVSLPGARDNRLVAGRPNQ
jgi:hypothetical protein